MGAELLAQAYASTGGVLAGVSAADLDRPTPCASWTVRDLVNHVVGGTFWFATIAETGAPPEGSGSDVADPSAVDFHALFADGSARCVAAFDAEGAMERTMKLPFGEMPGSAFVNLATGDAFTHGWDLAKATGQSTDLDAALATQLLAIVQVALPESFRGPEGQAPFGPIVEAPADASAADQLAAFMGRQP